MFNEVISEGVRIPVKIWAKNLEEGARKQAINLANMPCAFHHVSLMPDAHQGYGMPIGGVLALKNAVCPNAVGVDIGCGMIAIRTDVKAEALKEMSVRRKFQQLAKSRIPVGEGHPHKDVQEWDGFADYAAEIDNDPCHINWLTDADRRNLGTLGGGNHFIELQQDDTDDHFVWLMIHSGSRNLGKRIADHYNKVAFDLCSKFYVNLPDKDLAFLPTSTPEGESYIRAMNFALKYARESRKRMMDAAFECLAQVCSEFGVTCEEEFRHDITTTTRYGRTTSELTCGSTGRVRRQRSSARSASFQGRWERHRISLRALGMRIRSVRVRTDLGARCPGLTPVTG